jgi:hypothetical protein
MFYLSDDYLFGINMTYTTIGNKKVLAKVKSEINNKNRPLAIGRFGLVFKCSLIQAFHCLEITLIKGF